MDPAQRGPWLRIVLDRDEAVLDAAVATVFQSLASVQFEAVPGMNLMQWLCTALLHRPGMWAPKVFVVLMGSAMLPALAERWLAFPQDAAHPRLARALDSYANLCNETGALRAFLGGAPDANRAVPAGSTAPFRADTHDFRSVRVVAPPGPALVDTVRWLVCRFATSNEVAAASDAAAAGRAPVVIVPVTPPEVEAWEHALYGYTDPSLSSAFADLKAAGWRPPGLPTPVLDFMPPARGSVAEAATAAAAAAVASAAAASRFDAVKALLPRVNVPQSLPRVAAAVERLGQFVHTTSFKYLLFKAGKGGLAPRRPITEAGNNIGNNVAVKLLPPHCIGDVDTLVAAFEFEVQCGEPGVYPGAVSAAAAASSSAAALAPTLGFHLPIEFARRGRVGDTKPGAGAGAGAGSGPGGSSGSSFTAPGPFKRQRVEA